MEKEQKSPEQQGKGVARHGVHQCEKKRAVDPRQDIHRASQSLFAGDRRNGKKERGQRGDVDDCRGIGQSLKAAELAVGRGSVEGELPGKDGGNRR